MLPVVDRAGLGVEPIDWLGLHREYFNSGELQILVALARSIGARSMLEIGCRDGRTARLMLYNVVTLSRYVGVDVIGDYEPSLVCQRGEMVEHPGELVRHDPLFELMLRARGSLDLTPGDFPEWFDLVYIDGDHSAAAVMHDSELAFQVTRPGGLVVWHDVGNAAVEVTEVIDELAAHRDIRAIDGTWLAYTVM